MSKVKSAVLGLVISGMFMSVANAGIILGEPITPAEIPSMAPAQVSPQVHIQLGEPVVSSPVAPVVQGPVPLHIQLGQPVVQSSPVVNAPVHIILGEPIVSSPVVPSVPVKPVVATPRIEF